MKRILIACLISISWHPRCSSCKPVEVKAGQVHPTHAWEAFKDPKGISENGDHLQTRKSNGFHPQTSENHPIEPSALGSPNDNDAPGESPKEPTQVPSERENGPKKATANPGTTDESQSKETSAAPEKTKRPENVASGATKPWFRRTYNRLRLWFHTSPSLAARSARFLVRWLTWDKAKRKTAEQVKEEKEKEELEKYIKLAYKAREVDPTLVIKQETDAIPKGKHDVAKDTQPIAKEPKGMKNEADRTANEPDSIDIKHDATVKEQSTVAQEEEFKKFRRMFQQVVLELVNQPELKGSKEKKDEDTQRFIQMLQRLSLSSATGSEKKAQ